MGEHVARNSESAGEKKPPQWVRIDEESRELLVGLMDREGYDVSVDVLMFPSLKDSEVDPRALQITKLLIKVGKIQHPVRNPLMSLYVNNDADNSGIVFLGIKLEDRTKLIC